ncbi:PLP-dependent aminotransferase family protein [Sphingobacterium sp. SRCM116780]|uniref:MocR-like pyridoxine biosynthesis transcription factor PdxR n=1 Tax=Sphingobacterium sp. SRCM116780 TaxID=2907623 RepID=UPI001F3DC57C|nr:PLP-dependent aminotransferase family protein [Sphingobacterium sp. SRCM116780]UIR56974.1 PLP-dependent aminotransferase family protein [Sphingobacterium sp. SRCM116780]
MLPYKSLIQLDRDSSIALYIQICNNFITLITKGILQPADILPSSRILADLIEVNRNTIKLAYEELISQGWAESIERKGVFALSNLPIRSTNKMDHELEKFKSDESFIWNKPPEISGERAHFKKLNLTIDGGFPDVRMTPVDLLMREYRSISRKFYGKDFLKYGNPKGSERLRIILSSYLANTRGLVVNPENILITKGSQMGIFLSAQLLLNPLDHVAVGVSNYNAADETFQYRGANLVRIPIDEYGMDVDYLEDVLREKNIKAVYIVPHHHFPTTVTMIMERRLKLLNLAKEYRFAIIEDDYDFDFHYNNKPYLPLASIDHHHNVIYIGSITKTFAPALRIGFLISSQPFVEAATALRHMVDRQGDSLLEEAFSALFENGEMERHYRKSLKVYKTRRDLFCELLQKNFNGVIDFKIPEGGLAVWSVFDKNIDLKKMSENALSNGLNVEDGSFYKNEVFNVNGIRMGFASLNEAEIQQALDILKKSL